MHTSKCMYKISMQHVGEDSLCQTKTVQNAGMRTSGIAHDFCHHYPRLALLRTQNRTTRRRPRCLRCGRIHFIGRCFSLVGRGRHDRHKALRTVLELYTIKRQGTSPVSARNQAWSLSGTRERPLAMPPKRIPIMLPSDAKA